MEQLFGVWGFISGAALPQGSLILDSVEIRRLEGKDLEHALAQKRTGSYMSGIKLGHQVRSSEVHVYSPWVARWTLRAPSEQKAFERVEKWHMPRLLTALNTLSKSTYRVELMRVGEVEIIDKFRGIITGERSLYKLLCSFTLGSDVRALSKADEDLLRSRLRLLQERSPIWGVARYYQEALLLLDLKGGLPSSMTAAAFTSFHRFIEGVVTALYKKDFVSTDDQIYQRELVDNLLNKLQNTNRRGKHVPAILETAKELTNIQNSGFRKRLISVVQEIGGDEFLKDELCKFYDFRNKYFAHSGEDISKALEQDWAQRSANACRTLLDLWLSSEEGREDSISVSDEIRHDAEVIFVNENRKLTAKFPNLD